ncbi:MAG: GNAT family N-acetyltransferase [Syntrophaceae bacterium]|nr:GNAT family N-acetyltransferase [Syntrophaceae bacterium]
MNAISYKKDAKLNLDEVIELYDASTLGERRPLHNRDVMQGMIDNASLIITAWDEAKLVGIARTLTDFCNVAYLADLAVHSDYQRQGIGRELIKQTRDALNPTCSIVLLSAPKANDYYPKVGFKSNPRGWTMEPKKKP